SDSHLDAILISTLRGPIVLWAIILGLHVATQNSEIPPKYLSHFQQTLELLWAFALTIAASRLAGSLIRFYGGSVTGAKTVTSLSQKLVQVAIVIIGAMWMLK